MTNLLVTIFPHSYRLKGTLNMLQVVLSQTTEPALARITARLNKLVDRAWKTCIKAGNLLWKIGHAKLFTIFIGFRDGYSSLLRLENS